MAYMKDKDSSTKEKSTPLLRDVDYRKAAGLTAIAAVGALLVIKFDAVCSFVKFVNGAFAPLLYGIIIAFVLNVPMKAIERLMMVHGRPRARWMRPVAVTVTYLLFLALIAVVVRIVAPQIIDSTGNLLSNATRYATSAATSLNEFFAYLGLSFRIDVSGLTSSSLSQLEGYLTKWFSKLTSVNDLFSDSVISNISVVAKAIFSGMVDSLAAMIISVYLLADKEHYIRICRNLIHGYLKPEVAKRVGEVYHVANGIFNGFVGGFMTEMMILGTLFYIVLSLSRMPYALLISVVIALTSIMPYVGTTLAMIFGAFLILADRGVMTMVVFIIEFVIVQQLENNLIYPRVVGHSVGVPSFYVLIAITVFGTLFGVLGLVVAVPLMALIYTLVRADLAKRLKRAAPASGQKAL